MNLFGKNIPKAAQKGLVKIALLVVGICAFISIPVVLSLGWFASNNNTTANGMQVVVSTDTYDILVDRVGSLLYDPSATNAEGELLYQHIDKMQNALSSDGYDLNSTEALRLGIELINERHSLSIGYNLAPGAYGTATFYIRPHEGYDNTTVTLSLQIVGYKSYNNSVVPADSTDALNMLQGHLLFFESRTGAEHDNYKYSDLLNGNLLVYNMNEHSKCTETGKTDCYEITIYWEWPITYDEITENTSTTDIPQDKKYPVGLASYVSAHPEYFFAVDTTGMTEEQKSAYYSSMTQEKKIDSYNDGDQLIGDNINFVAVFIN